VNGQAVMTSARRPRTSARAFQNTRLDYFSTLPPLSLQSFALEVIT
jgi:hypothetical protein